MIKCLLGQAKLAMDKGMTCILRTVNVVIGNFCF